MPFCCADDDDKDSLPTRYKENRSCTDCLCFLLFVAFWGGFIAVAAVAFAKGRPERLIYGTDYIGNRCGSGSEPLNFASYILSTSPWQSQTWSENTLLWYPIPFSNASLSLDLIINSGVCVKTCPSLNESIISMITSSVDISSYSSTIQSYLTVSTYGATSVDNVTVFAPASQYVLYSSQAFFHRCMPSGFSPAAMNQTLSQVPYYSEVSQFFFRGFAELGAAWRVMLITFFIAFVICLVYVFVMRFLVKVLVYLAIFLGFALLLLGGAAAWNRYKALDAVANDPNSNQSNYVHYYLAAAIIMWVCAGLYLLLVLFLRKRISLACAIIKISGRVMASSPLLLLVPIIIGILVGLVAAWSLAVGVYLYSAQDFEYKPELIPVFNASASSYYGDSNGYVNVSGQLFANATAKINSISFSRRDLVFYDLFGFLWSMGFINAVGYMIVSFVTIFWYFSDLDDSKKEVPSNGIRLGVWWTLRYHLGTLAFGSLIIAIIQFVRIIMNYMYHKSKAIKENDVAKIVFCVANCILACFERVIQVISKNAYILCAITNKSFCCAARDAFELVIDNALTIFLLNMIVEMVMIFGKFVVTIGSMLVAYLLMKYVNLAPGVDTYIFPLICIGFVAYFIAALFFSVYSVAVDSNFVCYCYDRKINAGKGLYYVPTELEDQISNYNKAQRLEEMSNSQAAAAKQPTA